MPVYGSDFRSVPVFFLQDDHDHWDNDSVADEITSFPIQGFQLQLARARQQLYYPEFLPDGRRPADLPWSGTPDRGNLSESFGTVRYGDLAEIRLYDVRRTMSLGGPNAVFVDPQVERWLLESTGASGVRHLVHAPSNPSVGALENGASGILTFSTASAGSLTTAVEKPHWQGGWLRQPDRLAQAIGRQAERVGLVISGDLHAIAVGRIHRAGSIWAPDRSQLC